MRKVIQNEWGSFVLRGLIFKWTVLMAVFGGGSFLQAVPNVWINEIHYDDSGADAGEGVEIAGVAGTVLDGFLLQLYNGSGGSLYGTTVLTGTIPDQQNGFGALSFAVSGLQNGAPDGLALADAASALIQFLSYEGSFTAANGVALGITSLDIGVAETSSTAEGLSLQLNGSGTTYAEFTWQSPASATFGSVNRDQTFPTHETTTTSVPDSGASHLMLALALLGLVPWHRPGQGGVIRRSSG